MIDAMQASALARSIVDFIAALDAREVTRIWPLTAIRRLVELWMLGVTTPRIARELDKSKNAICGKARRLKLPARPCPICRRAEGRALARSAEPSQSEAA